jgi:hypothetical protein
MRTMRTSIVALLLLTACAVRPPCTNCVYAHLVNTESVPAQYLGDMVKWKCWYQTPDGQTFMQIWILPCAKQIRIP